MYNPPDYSTISFPWLGIEINPNRIIDLGFMQIRWYGLIIAVGLMLAVIYSLRRSKQFGLTHDDILDGVLWIVPVAIICARLYYCIFSWEHYAADPISILHIWEGGLAIYGGVIGAAVGIVVYCKIKKISTLAVLDLVAIAFLIGQFIGRWGNFFNREAFGSEITGNFFMRMGLFNDYTQKFQYFHPTFLYESLWNLMGFVLLHFLSKKRKYDGQMALSYVAWYGLGRTLIEGLRTDSLYWGPFRVSQLLAAVSCFAALGILAYRWLKPSTKPLFVDVVAAQSQEESEDSDEDTQEETEEQTQETPEETEE